MAKQQPVLFEPWRPPATTNVQHVAAIKALAAGKATEEQQRIALHFLLVDVCGVDDEPFCPGEDGRRSTDFALGKRRVGTFIRSLIHVDIKKFKDPNAAPTEQP